MPCSSLGVNPGKSKRIFRSDLSAYMKYDGVIFAVLLPDFLKSDRLRWIWNRQNVQLLPQPTWKLLWWHTSGIKWCKRSHPYRFSLVTRKSKLVHIRRSQRTIYLPPVFNSYFLHSYVNKSLNSFSFTFYIEFDCYYTEKSQKSASFNKKIPLVALEWKTDYC